MKLKLSIKLLLSTAVALPLMTTVVPVLAVDGTSPDDPVSSQDSGQATEKTREERIRERKDKLRKKLSQVEKNTVKTKCASANGRIKSSQARLKSFAARRTKVYSGVVERLEALSPKLKAAGVDTAAFDSQVAELKTKAEAYSTAITSLQQAIDDLSEMDCTADPEGFVASLKAAITLRADVIEKGQDFRTYLKDTLRPTLTEIRKQLETANNDSED